MPHLFVHEDVNKRVDNSGELCQQRGHDARLWGYEVLWPKGCQQSCYSVWQPADQVAHHHGDDHHQHPLLPAAGHHRTFTADLKQTGDTSLVQREISQRQKRRSSTLGSLLGFAGSLEALDNNSISLYGIRLGRQILRPQQPTRCKSLQSTLHCINLK